MDKAIYAAFFLLNNKLNRILNLLGDEVMPALDGLTAAIDGLEVSVDSVLTKLQAAIDAAKAGGVDPAQLQALQDRVTAAAAKLDAAPTA